MVRLKGYFRYSDKHRASKKEDPKLMYGKTLGDRENGAAGIEIHLRNKDKQPTIEEGCSSVIIQDGPAVCT